MSEGLEAEVKTNPQGDPITSAPAAPKADSGKGRKDPHGAAKKPGGSFPGIYVF